MRRPTRNTLETDRLHLRPVEESDLTAMIRLNSDPRVMEFFPSVLDEKGARELIQKIREKVERYGFAFWALELKPSGQVIGIAGLSVPGFQAHFTPCVEVGWRLEPAFWGQGLAQEAARAALRFGWEDLDLQEIVAITTVKNVRSRRVMERIGMTRDLQGDFLHPTMPKDHPIAPHVLYRIQKPTP
jgi:ribosomal-protein-alanine N-acetyltransferase